uniref:FAD-binding domain-containing protein n=1 Tax=Timspurckia oligopyrenoides TaxID=708627 RepID=A0A7S1ET01_9RHOD|mmetsp:Transcript_5066/g.8832  ORF Transcript_5066/g.8832 Transcript_5066/m.8832 type:complete len:468 (+) Transcript_5066:29-1432(+)
MFFVFSLFQSKGSFSCRLNSGSGLSSKSLICAVSRSSSDSVRSRKPENVAIVGSGIGGLSAALALLKTQNTGVDKITIFESRKGLDTDLGGALNINGGASVLINKYDLPIETISRPFSKVVARNADGSINGGRTLFELDLDKAVNNNPRAQETLRNHKNGNLLMLSVMRDTLQKMLYDEVMATEKVEIVRRRVSWLELVKNSKARVILDAADVFESEFDLIIGADGVKSVVRAFLAGNGSQERANYSGIRVQFAVNSKRYNENTLTNGVVSQWFGNGGFALHYGAGKDNELIAFPFRSTRKSRENSEYDSASIQDDCRHRMETCGMPLEIVNALDRCDRFIDTSTYYHKILPSSSNGVCILLGDSFHAMPPFLGQGANQSIQDAHVLAKCISEIGVNYSNQQSALLAYERIRKGPTAKIITTSRLAGWMETQPAPLGTFIRNSLFQALSSADLTARIFLNSSIPEIL